MTFTFEQAWGLVGLAFRADYDHRLIPSELRRYNIMHFYGAAYIFIANRFLLLRTATAWPDMSMTPYNQQEQERSKRLTFALPPYDDAARARLGKAIRAEAKAYEAVFSYLWTLLPHLHVGAPPRGVTEESVVGSITNIAEFCLSIGPEDPRFWPKVYARMGVEYTDESPQGNQPQQA